MSDTGQVIVIHQGSKFYWRTRNSIDVTIVDHKEQAVIEIITYEPYIDVEADRIYLDSAILSTKLDQKQIEEKLSFAKQNDVAHTEKFVSDISRQAAVDYILSRLFLAEFSVDPKQFAVRMQFSFGDRDLDEGDDSIDRLVRDPPADFLPHKTHHHKIFSAEEKAAAARSLEQECQTLQEHCKDAMALQAQTSLPLGIKERWRIPIVLARLAQGRRLSGADDKIWAAVASNLKTQDDIDRVTAVTMRTVPPPIKIIPRAVPPIGRPGLSRAPSERPVLSRTPSERPALVRTPTHTPHRSPCITPHRSPCITPRGTSSSRLLVGTVSSENRANATADDAPPRKVPRKQSKLGKKKSTRQSASRLGAHSTSTDMDPENDPADYSGGSDINNSETVTFMSQLVSGLASLTSFKQSDTRKLYATNEDAALNNNQFSFRGSVKADGTPVTSTGSQVSAESVGEQRRSLSTFQPHLLGTTSTMPSLRGEFAFLSACDITPSVVSRQSMGIADGGDVAADQSDVAAAPAADGSQDEVTAPPRKRRSFFGSLLSSFIRADSGLSLGADSNSGGGSGGGAGSTGSPLKKQPSKRGGKIMFGDALAGWMNWGSGQVAPADLSADQPIVAPSKEPIVEPIVQAQ